MSNAIAAVKDRTMSIRQASNQFGIPKSTLGDRISGRLEEGATPGKKPVLPVEVESAIANKIKEAGKMRFGITRAQLCFKVARLVSSMKLSTPFRNGVPGKD